MPEPSRLHVPPHRDGVGPSCIVLPPGAWSTVLDFLAHRFPSVCQAEWAQRMSQGKVIGQHGTAFSPESPYQSQLRVYYYRELGAERPIPFAEVILFQDEHLIVVDKPHFLPVVPSGGYLQETVLVRLKRKLNLASLAPLHRIDRDTAGLVMFSVRAQDRALYNALFRQRKVSKTYEAIAPWQEELQFPMTRQSRIEEAGHFMQQIETQGPVNAVTELDVLAVRGHQARYALRPITGQRHQLRVHMAALGLPIEGDGIYPTLTPEGQIDYERPLQLLAKSIEFTDPITGQVRRFESQRRLNWR